MNEKAYFSLLIGVPPLNEQTELIATLSRAVEPISTAIARTEREIALMQEYRTRLTADIVSGKLDVREAAAKLPDVRAVGKSAEDDVSVNDDCDNEVDDSI